MSREGAKRQAGETTNPKVSSKLSSKTINQIKGGNYKPSKQVKSKEETQVLKQQSKKRGYTSLSTQFGDSQPLTITILG
jgi:hypothetical protein